MRIDIFSVELIWFNVDTPLYECVKRMFFSLPIEIFRITWLLVGKFLL